VAPAATKERQAITRLGAANTRADQTNRALLGSRSILPLPLRGGDGLVPRSNLTAATSTRPLLSAMTAIAVPIRRAVKKY